MPPVWIGLMVAFASALVTNTVYPLEHGAAALPASPRRRIRSTGCLVHVALPPVPCSGEEVPAGGQASKASRHTGGPSW
jgi:hypothetical protein